MREKQVVPDWVSETRMVAMICSRSHFPRCNFPYCPNPRDTRSPGEMALWNYNPSNCSVAHPSDSCRLNMEVIVDGYIACPATSSPLYLRSRNLSINSVYSVTCVSFFESNQINDPCVRFFDIGRYPRPGLSPTLESPNRYFGISLSIVHMSPCMQIANSRPNTM